MFVTQSWRREGAAVLVQHAAGVSCVFLFKAHNHKSSQLFLSAPPPAGWTWWNGSWVWGSGSGNPDLGAD